MNMLKTNNLMGGGVGGGNPNTPITPTTPNPLNRTNTNNNNNKPASPSTTATATATATMIGGKPNPLNDFVTDTIISGFPHRIPKALAMLRATLMSRDGLKLDGIFRERGEESEIKMIREKLGKGQPFKSGDMYSVATCIKLYLREMVPLLFSKSQSQHQQQPNQTGQLLNPVAGEVIMDVFDEDGAYKSLGMLSYERKDLLEWCLDLMADVVYYESENGMGIRSICKYKTFFFRLWLFARVWSVVERKLTNTYGCYFIYIYFFL
jgi:hypothetical protein